MAISHIFGKGLRVVRMTISVTSTETAQAPDHVYQTFPDLSIASRIEYFLPDFLALPFTEKNYGDVNLTVCHFSYEMFSSIIKRLDSK